MKYLIIVIAIGVLLGLGACISTSRYNAKMADLYPPSGEVVTVGGADVHVLTAGATGPVVLMIHGASANAREFEWSLAPRLSDTHRILMPDRPGHGHSSRPEHAETLGKQAELMVGALEALAPGEKAIVVGHSFGGAVALRVALDYPDKVDSLVLLAPVSHDWGGGGEAWYNAWLGNPLIGPLFSQLGPIVGPSQEDNAVEGVFAPQPAPEGYFQKSGIGQLFRPHEFRANAKDVNALREELMAQQDRYTDLTLPIIVYSGSQDTVIKPQLHVGKLKHQAADLTLIALPDEGHMPHHGQGAEIAASIRDLSGRQPAVAEISAPERSPQPSRR